MEDETEATVCRSTDISLSERYVNEKNGDNAHHQEKPVCSIARDENGFHKDEESMRCGRSPDAQSDSNENQNNTCLSLQEETRPSKCEDFESDESEFEDDEILLVLRKKRKELIKKLWMIDELMNKK